MIIAVSNTSTGEQKLFSTIRIAQDYIKNSTKSLSTMNLFTYAKRKANNSVRSEFAYKNLNVLVYFVRDVPVNTLLTFYAKQ